MNRVAEIKREDIHFMVIRAAKNVGMNPRIIYTEMYKEIEKRTGKNLSALAEKFKILKMDVLESEKLFPEASKVLKEKFGVKYD